MTVDDHLAVLVGRLAGQQRDMVDLLGALVSSESPSGDPRLLATTAELLARAGERLLGSAPARVGTPTHPALRWDLAPVGSEAPPVVLLAHLDTVWPAGTVDRWPFVVADGRATGPGAFDMKAGIVQALYALAYLLEAQVDRPPVVLLVTADEEIGSPDGRALVEAAAQHAGSVLVLEASADGGLLKTGRKGVGNYRVCVTGRAAHAGLEPEKGSNALVALSHLVLALNDLARPELGSTVTPTVAQAGTAQNTVPAEAWVAVDVRAVTLAEQQRIDDALHRLSAPPGTTVRVEGGINRPPLEDRMAQGLFQLAQRAAQRLGLPALSSAHVGGGSDGNFTAALGVRTLDGLGAVGGGAHAEGEHVLVTALPERAALLAGLIVELGGEAP